MVEDAKRPKLVLTQAKRTKLMLDLCKVVKQTGQHVLSMTPGGIYDTVEVASHQFSTVDAEASSKLRSAITEIMGAFPGTVFEESEIPRAMSDAVEYPLLIGDAVEGSTNAKRGLASSICRRPIQAGVSVMVLEGERLSTIAASAFYDFASGKVFSSMRSEEGEFLAFIDEHIVQPGLSGVVECTADTQRYAVVPGYSHDNVEQQAQVGRALQNRGIWMTGGSRSSAQDMVDMICNQIDAYVDLRCLFSGSQKRRDEVLHSWDTGGILPVMDGLGFAITDVHGETWQRYRFRDPMALVVARPSLVGTILEALRDLSFAFPESADQGPATVQLPPRELGS